MNFLKFLILTLFVLGLQTAKAQTDKELITATLMDYIEGTANGERERVEKAFHPDLNLYSVKDGGLRTWAGKDYISGIRKSNRIGKIIAIDYVNDAASAKIEIKMPDVRKLFTDYLLLLKLDGKWTIIHKSYTAEKY